MIKDRREFLKTAATMAFAPMAFATNFDNLFSQININSLSELKTYLSEHINKVAQKMFVSGSVFGVYHKGEQILIANGKRNINTGEPMTTDTAWLLGSITKVLTTTLLLKYVEAGKIDLDAPVVKYLENFRLKEPGAAEKIIVKQLINHTNGIDAGTLMPTSEYGPNAVKSYVDALSEMGTLFSPGEFIHYSNPGYSLAGRLIEKFSGKPFNLALEEEIYKPIGMSRSSTSAEQAILDRTAVGAFVDSKGEFRSTNMFMLPVSAAAAGATPIVTIEDIIAFGRTHLNDGIAPNGKRILNRELISSMHTPTFDSRSPNVPPIGLGWWLIPIGGTTAWWHSGGSPGGYSNLTVLPEHDLVLASFNTGPGSAAMNEVISRIVLEDYLGLKLSVPFKTKKPTKPMSYYTGVYELFQSRYTIKEVEDGLIVNSKFLPFNEEQIRILSNFSGGNTEAPDIKLKLIQDNLFKVESLDEDYFASFTGRFGLMSFHSLGNATKPTHLQMRLRAAKKVS
tara:strand:- start:266 stop:1792 length:1527 start_codon:yes stop_codon:yes gene_type:complete